MTILNGLLVPAAPGAHLTHGAVERADHTARFWIEGARHHGERFVRAIRSAVRGWREIQQVRATRAALASLDSATLRDLGLFDSVDTIRERYRGQPTRFL